MAKKGMARPDRTHTKPRNDVPPVPEIQGKAKHGKEQAHPVIVKAVSRTSRCREGGRTNKRLDLCDQGAAPLHDAADAVAPRPLGTLPEKDLRGIRYLGKPRICHIKHTDLVGRAVTVLHGTDDPIGLLTVTLKIQDGIHHMLKDLWSRDPALLVHVTDKEHGRTAFLRIGNEGRGAFAHLRNAPRRRA